MRARTSMSPSFAEQHRQWRLGAPRPVTAARACVCHMQHQLHSTRAWELLGNLGPVPYLMDINIYKGAFKYTIIQE